MNRRHIRKLPVASIFWLILQASSSVLYANDLIYEGFWTNDINPDNTSRQIYTETAPIGGTLYLCISIKGKKDILDILRDGSTLSSIRHKWFRYIGTHPFFEGAKKPINVLNFLTPNPPSNRSRNEELSVEQLEWFMCSEQKQIPSGWWQVEMVYTNNEPVMCNGKPCTYKLFIK